MTKAKTPLAIERKKARAAEKKAVQRAEKKRAQTELTDAQTRAQQNAAQLAQIVNLHIAGFSLSDIGASIGASADEVDRILQNDTARYVRTQPALRTYVRNYVSGKYNELLHAVWDEATDKKHPAKLENQDRALRILDRMAKLHGADAPTQTEVKVEAQPEAVENMVKVLAAAQGVGYDDTVFDIVDAEVIDAGVEAETVSGNQQTDADEKAVDDGSEPL